MPIGYPRSNLNMMFGEGYREYRHINAVKGSQRVVGSTPLDADWYTKIDANDYPTEAVKGEQFTVYPPIDDTSTVCVVKWLGSGSVDGNNLGSKTNSSKGSWTGGGASGTVVTNGRFTCTFTNSTSPTSLFTMKGTTINSLVVCRLDEEDAYDAGQVFRTAFITLLQSLNPLCLRPMDSVQVNTGVIGLDWNERPSLDRVTYNGTAYIPNRKVGLITGTNDKIAAAYTGMPATYTHGEFFHGHMEAANDSANVTIDSGGRGAKTVWQEPGFNLVGTGTNAEVRLLTGQPYTFVYDQYFDKFLFNRQGAKVGHPIELFVQLSNLTGIPLWVNVHYYATDAYMESLAQYLCDNYEASIIYIERNNEVWNTASGFPMTSRYAQQGLARWSLGASGSAGMHGAYCYQTRRMSEVMKAVFEDNGQGTKPKVVLANQGAAGNQASDLTTINALRWHNESVPDLAGANGAINHSDVISYAYYASGNKLTWLDSQWTANGNLSTVKAAVDDFLSGDPVRIQTAFDWALADLTTDSIFYNTTFSNRFTNFNAAAASYGLPVILYEANFQVAPPSTSFCANSIYFSDSTYGGHEGKINQFLHAFYQSDQYYEAQWRWLELFYAHSQSAGGSMFALCQGEPWLTLQKRSPLATTNSVEALAGGDSRQPPYQNWVAHRDWNTSLQTVHLTATT